MVLKHFPAPPLREAVELFWYSSQESTALRAAPREAILLDGYAHLVINLSQNRIGLYERIESNKVTALGGSIFSAPRSSPYAIVPAAADVIGVLFRPSGVFETIPRSLQACAPQD